jgi:hypothetical protein
MGGTDLDDQYVAYYEFHHKSKAWQRRIYSHFLFVAARNAHVIYNDTVQGEPDAEQLPQFLDFLEVLICDLLGYNDEDIEDQDFDDNNSDFSDFDDFDFDDEDFDDDEFVAHQLRNNPNGELEVPGRRYPGWISDDGWRLRHDGRCHYPCDVNCIVDMKDTRGNCIVCSKKGSTKCPKCNVTLHCNGVGENNCWIKFHQTRNFR